MRFAGLTLAAVFAALAASPALADRYEPLPKANVGFIRTADRFWAGAIELPPCSRPDVERRFFRISTPRFITASQQRHGELIGEILSPPPMVQLVVAKARDCAGAASEPPALLTQGEPAFTRFRSAFAACMVQQDAAQYVGSMTLWIDNQCNW